MLVHPGFDPIFLIILETSDFVTAILTCGRISEQPKLPFIQCNGKCIYYNAVSISLWVYYM